MCAIRHGHVWFFKVSLRMLWHNIWIELDEIFNLLAMILLSTMARSVPNANNTAECRYCECVQSCLTINHVLMTRFSNGSSGLVGDFDLIYRCSCLPITNRNFFFFHFYISLVLTNEGSACHSSICHRLTFLFFNRNSIRDISNIDKLVPAYNSIQTKWGTSPSLRRWCGVPLNSRWFYLCGCAKSQSVNLDWIRLDVGRFIPYLPLHRLSTLPKSQIHQQVPFPIGSIHLLTISDLRNKWLHFESLTPRYAKAGGYVAIHCHTYRIVWRKNNE